MRIAYCFVLLLMVVLATGCGDQYRYPCQDPNNWKNTECNPPICEASQTCTKDLVEIGK